LERIAATHHSSLITRHWYQYPNVVEHTNNTNGAYKKPVQANDQQQTRHQHGRLLRIASYLLLLLIALPLRVANLGAFLSGDEADFWLPRSERFLQAIQSGDLAATAITTHPGITTMWCGAAGIALRRFLFENHILQQETFPLLLALHRLPLALVHTAALLVGYALLRRMVAPTIALLAALLWATDPFVLAFSRVLHVDGPATTFATLCLLAACLYWNHARQFRWLLLSAIFAGLAIVSKSPAFLLLPTVGMLALWAAWQDTRRTLVVQSGQEPRIPRIPRIDAVGKTLQATLLPLVVWGMLCGITMALVWPAVLTDPLRVIELFRVGVEVEGGSPHMLGNFFLGQHTDVPGPMFYPVALAMRTTPITLIGLLLLPIAIFISQRNARVTATATSSAPANSITMRDLAVLTGWILLFTLAMSIFPKKFNRYLVPVFPALDILAAVGLVGMVQIASGSGRDRAGPRAKAQRAQRETADDGPQTVDRQRTPAAGIDAAGKGDATQKHPSLSFPPGGTLMVKSGQEPRIPRIPRRDAVVEPLHATALPPKPHGPSES
jgi:4-amino-4-deoxy-L-arabinose transferase-like glycosyltransferase